METQRHRFCWRERTERLNWRMLAALQLADVVKRGDPALLEPYALHLTFARLPAPVAGTGTDRDAWFLLRVMQLSMEYLLFLRARDGDVLEASGQELQQCEADRDALTVSGRKWKERTRSCERQIEKLHQLLQNIATLLQLHRATPEAVRTIETLIAELLNSGPRKRANGTKHGYLDDLEPTHRRQRAQEARVCGHCGKMFASKDFLQQHVERRHNGETLRRLPSAQQRRNAWSENVDEPNQKSDSGEDVRAKRMLREVELTLQSQQENLRSVAQMEALKIQELYEKLHVENQLAEELKTSRLQMEGRLKEQRALLDDLLHQKADATQELEDLKEQIAFYKVQSKMDKQSSASVTRPVAKDLATGLEIKRLEQTLAMAYAALAASREELSSLQLSHLVTLKEKRELSEQLEQAQRHAKRLEASLAQASGLEGVIVPVLRADSTTQTIKVEYTDATVETEVNANEGVGVPTEMKDDTTQTSIDDQPEMNNAEVQTEKQQPDEKESMTCLDTVAIPLQVMSQVENIWHGEHPEERKNCGISVGTDTSSPELLQAPDFVHELDKQALIETITARAQRAALNMKTTGNDRNPKQFSSMQRRNFLRSRFLHDENMVKERIGSILHALDETTRRYGLTPKSTVLSDEHLHIVQRALHAHLEILPTTVLEKIISCESEVNEMIMREWLPREKVRQEALEQLQVDAQAKSERNQRLVQQAMVTCTQLEAGQLKFDTVPDDDATPEDKTSHQQMIYIPSASAVIDESEKTKEDLFEVTDCRHTSTLDAFSSEDVFDASNRRDHDDISVLGHFNNLAADRPALSVEQKLLQMDTPGPETLENFNHETESIEKEATYFSCLEMSKPVSSLRSIGVKPRPIAVASSKPPLPAPQEVASSGLHENGSTGDDPMELVRYSIAASPLLGRDQVDEIQETNYSQLEPTMKLNKEKYCMKEPEEKERSPFITTHSAAYESEPILRKAENLLLRASSECNSSLRSRSVAASSELSYGASIPSLGSESETPKDDTMLSTTEMSVLREDSDQSPTQKPSTEESCNSDGDGIDEIPTLTEYDAAQTQEAEITVTLDTEANPSLKSSVELSCNDSDDDGMNKIPTLADEASLSVEQFVMVQSSAAAPMAQTPNASSPVMSFDDSDIEEVELN